MNDIENFFHHISPLVIALTKKRFAKNSQINYKNALIGLDISTEGDIDNEELIKQNLSEWFPEDKVIGEETAPNTEEINNGRIWIIDPICGSANFKNGIKFFSTNIAFAQSGKLLASCVIDHSRGEYIWSTGNGKLHTGKDLVVPKKPTKGISVDVDLSGIIGVEKEIVDRQVKLINFLLKNETYYLHSFSTSLIFAYVALGRIDAFINGHSNVWDVAAANFLIEQAGGKVTQTDGSPWTLTSNNVLSAFDPTFHSKLIKIINS